MYEVLTSLTVKISGGIIVMDLIMYRVSSGFIYVPPNYLLLPLYISLSYYTFRFEFVFEFTFRLNIRFKRIIRLYFSSNYFIVVQFHWTK